LSLDALKSHIEPLQQRQDAMLNRIIAWAETNSGSHHAAGLDRMYDLLAEAYGELGPEPVALTDLKGTSGKALHMRCRPEAPLRIFFSGHYDTVYGEDNPFQTVTDRGDGTINGPGVADMKGGLVLMLEVLRVLESYPGKDALGWELLIAPDEETGSIGTDGFLKQGAERNHLGLLFEPALPGGVYSRARPGSATYKLTCKGLAAHVGRNYAEGRNALLALLDCSQQIQAMADAMPGVICNLGKIQGGGPLNVVPDYGEAFFNIRVPRMEDAEALPGKIQEIAEQVSLARDVELVANGAFTRLPKEITPAIEQIFDGLKTCAQELNLELDWRDTGGCCDGNNLGAAGLPVMDSLGVRGGSLHSSSEFLEVDSLVERSQLAALYVLGLASGEIPPPTA